MSLVSSPPPACKLQDALRRRKVLPACSHFQLAYWFPCQVAVAVRRWFMDLNLGIQQADFGARGELS